MKRKEVAVQHLINATEELDAACTELRSVIGANSHYGEIKKLSIRVSKCRRLLNQHGNLPGDAMFKLDHKPSAAELERSRHAPRMRRGEGVKVVDDKKATWTTEIECNDCKSKLQIVAGDVHTERLGSFDEFETYYIVTCAACGNGIDVGKRKGIPQWVKTHAKAK